jgi:acetylornithine aminotransferase/acetylornithine/N-succinyldiaminopimelate aminotransferase
MIGIELKSDKAVDIKHKMFDMGFLVGSVGANIIRLLPPLIIEQEQIDLFMEKFEQAVAEVL